MNIKKLFKKIFQKHKKITREEAIQNINNSYHFKNFNVSLIDEIYTLLNEYGPIQISKYNDFKYDIIFPDAVIYKLTEDGLQIQTEIN